MISSDAMHGSDGKPDPGSALNKTRREHPALHLSTNRWELAYSAELPLGMVGYDWRSESAGGERTMKFYFCESCGKRLTEHDIEDGAREAARRYSGKGPAIDVGSGPANS